MTDWLGYLRPWEFSLPIWLLTGAALLLYLHGLRHYRQQAGCRTACFLAGLFGMLVVTQTYFDYLAQYMFFVHRGQHLVLHHVAPFLIALAAPAPVLAAGLPPAIRRALSRWWQSPLLQGPYRVLQSPVVASLLFVGLIYFWLMPEIHFNAMLSRPLYDVMNWSMALDGLLFWWIIFDRRPPGAPGWVPPGWRIGMLAGVMFPQIFLGAYIALSDQVMFDVYEVCGRAWPLSPITDQQLGGLLTWIPPAMMSALGVLLVLRSVLQGAGSRRPAPPSANKVPG